MSSSLSSLFNRGLLGARCKTCLNLSISRIKLLRNRREVQLAHMRKEIAQFLQTGQEAIARIRVEHVIREHNILAAYEIIELFCEFILARVPILDTQRTCPLELQEAVASIIFAAPRCSDVPELIQIKNLLTTKYGKEFVAAASELRPDSGVNRVIIEKLSIKAPPPDIKLGVMKTIAQEYNVDWDSSITEAEFNKKHEDLLDGLNEVDGNKSTEKSTISNPLVKGNEPVAALNQGQGIQAPAFRPVTISDNTPSSSPVDTSYSTNLLTSSNQQEGSHANDRLVAPQPSSDVLERARAAIASADRACAAARAAANLVNARMTSQTGSNKQGV